MSLVCWVEGGFDVQEGRKSILFGPPVTIGRRETKEERKTVRHVSPQFPFLGFHFPSCYESVRGFCAIDHVPTKGSAAELREQYSDRI